MYYNIFEEGVWVLFILLSDPTDICQPAQIFYLKLFLYCFNTYKL